MNALDKALQTQLDNIQKKTGMSLNELSDFVKNSQLSKHGEIREMLMAKLGLSHGDANSLVHAVLKSDGTRTAEGKDMDAVLDEIYSGPKSVFRTVHEALIEHLIQMGDFEILPKKGYVSLRRKKQFAMIGPKTNTRFEVGINARNLGENARLIEQPQGSMCNYIVCLTRPEEVDADLIAWLRFAFEGAG